MRAFLRLAVPSAIFAILTNGYRLVDQFWIQDVSVAAQAAVGSSVFVLILFYAAFALIALGAGPLVARATGARDPKRRAEVLGAAIFGCIVIALALMAVGYVAAPWISSSMGLTGQTEVECTLYLRALSLTILPLVLTPTVDHSFIVMGDAKTPLLLQAGSLALNFVLTPWFIFGLELGIVGAAYASNLSRAISTGAGLLLLMSRAGVGVRQIRPHPELRRIVRVGTPMAASTVAYALVYWVMLRTSISPLGPHVNAALGIGFSALEGFAWPCFHGASLAVSSLVGRALGAKEIDEAWRVVRQGLKITTGLGVVASGTFYFLGSTLTALFSEDAAVHAAATEYALILSASQLFVAWEALSEGVLAGAGDTKSVLWWSVPLNGARIPLAWMLAFGAGWGAAGIWWAINITTYAKVVGKGFSVWRGRWTELEL